MFHSPSAYADSTYISNMKHHQSTSSTVMHGMERYIVTPFICPSIPNTEHNVDMNNKSLSTGHLLYCCLVAGLKQ